MDHGDNEKCVPKETGNRRVDRQRPITLLNTRTEWITGVLKIMKDDVLMAITPSEQQDFVTGRSADRHLYQVWGT